MISIQVSQQSLKSDHSNASMNGEGKIEVTDTLLKQHLGLKEEEKEMAEISGADA